MSNVECPYCEALNAVCNDDGFGLETDTSHEMTCRDCKKRFVFYTHIRYHYSAHQVDCLNGAPHRFREWQFLWFDRGENTRQEQRSCQDCDYHERRTIKYQNP